MRTLLERFNEKYKPAESGCWLWTGSLRNGRYGQFWDGSKLDYAHRVSYRLFRGAIPANCVVCHRCDVQQCVNPEHLFTAPQVENVIDCVRKGRMLRIGNEKVSQIRRMLARGISQIETSRRLGVPRSTVRYWGVDGVREGRHPACLRV